jgi:hypothetical protein
MFECGRLFEKETTNKQTSEKTINFYKFSMFEIDYRQLLNQKIYEVAN